MSRRRKETEPEEQSFWQSYSDMMAALLLVFVLVIAFTISMAKSTYEEKQSELEAQNAAILEYQGKMDEQEAELEQQKAIMEEQQKRLQEQEEDFKEQQEVMREQQEQLDKIVGVRGNIIASLKNEFDNYDVDIHVDPETGAISFDSSILFDSSVSKLKKSGKKFLKDFFPKYMSIILRDDVRPYISEVIIEGHTDDLGGYSYNLELSQSRAYEVVKYCVDDDATMFKTDELESIRELITANGRAYFELIYDEKTGEVDRDASRRVEIKFRLTEEEMIQEMSEILENEK